MTANVNSVEERMLMPEGMKKYWEKKKKIFNGQNYVTLLL